MYYLGTINCASGGQASNWTTGASGSVPFTIPPSTKALMLEPNLAATQFQFGAATGISFLASPTNAAYIPDADVAAGPFRVIGSTVTVAVYSSAGACKVKVYGVPTS